MNTNSKIYIAGHTGLVGSAILSKLKSKGYSNLLLRTHKELDLTNSGTVSKFFKKEKPEYVFLAAAKVGGISANNEYRADFIYVNLMIQNNIIHNSYLNNVKKLLFLGSTCIYPKNCPQPMKESYLLTDVLEYTNEPYAIAKIAGIKMCESYNVQYQTNFISVMPTNLYGPNDNFDLEKSHVLPALLRKMHLGKALEDNNWGGLRNDFEKFPINGISKNATQTEIRRILAQYGIIEEDNKVKIEIWGSGNPKREFLWSEDMADACVFLMEKVNFKDIPEVSSSIKENVKKEIRNTHINIGTGEEISIKELACSIQDIVGFKGELFFNENKPDGTMRKLTDPSKLKKLGWSFNTSLDEGIKKVYDWYLNLNLIIIL
ncbi:GDP-L-fucose synthase [Gillisia sp. Hel_I_86]|uniref:GDP-L-fucose synthase family protein n=1 Tax=Gillisia sp. Hel_I_86 TaxID=1249981 RepID=UPI0011996697|nr:GDP-L-fucose synthase [Gillisia sp. Hel_I_86]TVZ27515.1 GDP-L-fucose synthase [Gillisia sp. Hel_I_86]